MTCEACGSEQVPLARYCIHCGRPFDVGCSECGFANPLDARFCGGCRKPLSGALAEKAGERRPITFLFCDLVDSTALFERLDPEDVREVQNAVRRLFGQLALAHDGHIAEYVGDGVVLYFGYPQAQENDAERAVRYGLEITRRVGSVHRTMRLGAPLSVRVGIHTSHAALGPVSPDDDRHWAAYGIATSITGRLQKKAPPGGVVVTEATWDLTRGSFTGRSLGEMELDGVSQRIVAWQVEAEAPAREWDDRRHTAAVFVGREQQRQRLDRMWRAALVGETRFALLRGEPGMGKSRLARYWRDLVAPTGASLVVLRATSNGRTAPFHPVASLLEKVFELGPAGAEGRLPRLVEELRRIGIDHVTAVPLLAPLLGIDAGESTVAVDIYSPHRRSRSIEVLVDVLRALCAHRPTLLIVEDLHWADASTLELMERVVATFPPLGLLGLLTARTEFDPTWGGRTGVQTIDLDPLGEGQQHEIARAVARGKALPGPALRQILARSEGVPLFVEELTRSMCESGMLREQAASWEIVASRWSDLIPMTVHAPLTARIDRLGPARNTAQLAATIGREFNVELLREVSGRDEPTLAQDLRDLTSAGLIFRSPEADAESYVFKHSLLRDAAYDLLSRQSRQEYHSRIAAALRGNLWRLAAGRNDLVAQHLTSAGEFDAAVEFWRPAGQDALLRAANLEAAGHFRRAIDCLAELPRSDERNRRELEVQSALAPVLFSVSGWASDEAERACRRVRDLAMETGRLDALYPALWGLWSVQFLRGELVAALPAAEAIQRMAEASGAPLVRVTAQHAVSYTRLYRGEFPDALAAADAGLALFDFAQEQELTAAFQLSSSVCLRQSRAQALWMLGRVAEADEEAERMVQLGRDLEHPASLAGALAFALHGGGMRHSYPGQLVRLRDVAEELGALSYANGFFMWYAVAETYLGLIDLELGEATALARVAEGLELFTQTRTRVTAVMMKVMAAEKLGPLGEEDAAGRLLTSAEAEADERHEHFYLPEIWRVRGRHLAMAGQVREAESAYRRALELAAAQRALCLELRAALDLHSLLAEDGRDAEGRAALEGVIEDKDVPWDLTLPEFARAVPLLSRPLTESGVAGD
jgi:class 3 adenylate cyclase